MDLIQVIVGRGIAYIEQMFYDKNWLKQAFFGAVILQREENTLPTVSLAKKMAAAEVLAEYFAFLRVDFYGLNQ